MGETYTGQTIRIAELAGDEGVIRDARFDNCVILGPAVLAAMGSTAFVIPQFNAPSAEAMFLELPAGQEPIVGAVITENCDFVSCKFDKIGLTGPAGLLQRLQG